MSGVLKMHKNVHTKTSLEARRCLDFFHEKNRKIHCCTTMLLVSSSCKKPRRRQTDGGGPIFPSSSCLGISFHLPRTYFYKAAAAAAFLPRNP